MDQNDRYFIFNHWGAFEQGLLSNLSWEGDGLILAPGEENGLFISPLLDSQEGGNRWQRGQLGVFRPEETRLTCRFFSVDRPYEALALEEMLGDPRLSPAEKLAALAGRQTFAVENAEDFLLFGVTGRYLIMAIELYRQEGPPPKIKELRLFASQESFLRYLPEIFQEEGGFLDRYLRLFSTQYLDLEREISRLPASFDPLVAPSGLLPWLAEIIGLPHGELWEGEKLRKLLSSRVYARKGTLSGLGDLLKIYTGAAPYLVECFRMRTGLEENDELYAGCRLLILLPAGAVDKKQPLEALHILIQSFLPQGISYKLITLADRARLSGYTYLDVNAFLYDHSPAVLDTDARIGYAMLEG